MLAHKALVVVADGHRAVLFRNVAKYGIELEEQERITPQHLQDESQGRQPEETTPKEEDEATFAKQLAERLNRMVLQHEFEELAIVADPNTLGVMRKHYHKALSAILLGEIAKDLTGHSLADVEKALVAG